MRPTKSSSRFDQLSRFGSRAMGKPLAFGFALGAVLLWIVTGPLFGFSEVG
jgi:low affinity Fe/Cu permease